MGILGIFNTIIIPSSDTEAAATIDAASSEFSTP
jgi:hypothetical protein